MKSKARQFRTTVLLRAATIFCGVSTFACQNYSDQLQRAQSYYERNQYEMALAVVRDLEANQDSLSQPDSLRYCYVRGMTDYRLGYKDDARYWLGLAKASLSKSPVALKEDEIKRLEESLAELNRPVYGIEEPSEEGADPKTSPSEPAAQANSGGTKTSPPAPVGASASSH